MPNAIFEGAIEISLTNAAKLEKSLEQVRAKTIGVVRELSRTDTEFRKGLRSATSYSGHVTKAMKALKSELRNLDVPRAQNAINRVMADIARSMTAGNEATKLAARAMRGFGAALTTAQAPATTVSERLLNLNESLRQTKAHLPDLSSAFGSVFGIAKKEFGGLNSTVSRAQSLVRSLSEQWEATGQVSQKTIFATRSEIGGIEKELEILVARYPELVGSKEFEQLRSQLTSLRTEWKKTIQEVEAASPDKVLLKGAESAKVFNEAMSRIKLPGGLLQLGDDRQGALRNAKLGFMLAARAGTSFTARLRGLTFALAGADKPTSKLGQSFSRLATALDGSGNKVNRFSREASRLTESSLDSARVMRTLVSRIQDVARAGGFGDKVKEFNILNRDIGMVEGSLSNLAISFKTTGKVSEQALNATRQQLRTLQSRMAELAEQNVDMFANPAVRAMMQSFTDQLEKMGSSTKLTADANKAASAEMEASSERMSRSVEAVKQKFTELSQVVGVFAAKVGPAFRGVVSGTFNVVAKGIGNITGRIKAALPGTSKLRTEYDAVSESAKKVSESTKVAESAFASASGASDKYAGSMENVTGSMEKVIAKGVLLGNIMTEVAKKAMAALGEIAQGMDKVIGLGAVKVAARVETLEDALILLSHNAGEALDYVRERVETLKEAGITTETSLVSVAKFLTTQLPLDTIDELARAAQNMAVVFGVNSSEAFNKFTQAILTGNMRILRSIGITGYLNDVYERYAATVGKTKDALNEADRRLAILNFIMQRATAYSGAYERAMDSVGKQLTSLPRYIIEAGLAFGRNFIPALSGAVLILTDFFKKLQAVFKKLQPIVRPAMERVKKAMLSGWETVIKGVSAAFNTIKDIVGGIARGLKPFINTIRALFEYFGPVFGEQLKRIGNILKHVFGDASSSAATFAETLARMFSEGTAARVMMDILYIGLVNVQRILSTISLLMKGDFSMAAWSMKNVVADAVAGIIYFFDKLVVRAFKWGWNLVQEWASGFVKAASQVISTVLTWFGNVIRDFIGAFSPPRRGPLKNIVQWAINLMNTYLEGFGEAEFAILDRVLSPIQQHLEKVLTMKGLKDPAIVKRVVEMRLEVTELIDEFRRTGKIPVEALEKLNEALGEGGEKFAKLIELQMRYEKAVERLRDVEEEMREAQAAGFVPRELRDRLDAAQQEVDEAQKQISLQEKLIKYQEENLSLMQRLMKAMDKLADKIGGIGDDIKDKIKDAIELPEVTPFPEMEEGETLAERLGLTDLGYEVSEEFEKIRQAVRDFIDLPLGEKFDAIVKKLEELTGLDISGFIEGLKKKFRELKEKALELLDKVDWEKLKTEIQKPFKAAWDYIKKIDWDDILQGIEDFVDDVIEFFTKLYNELVGESLIPDTVTESESWWTRFKENLAQIAEDVEKAVDKIVAPFVTMKERMNAAIGEPLAAMGLIAEPADFTKGLGDVIKVVLGAVAAFAAVVLILVVVIPKIIAITTAIGTFALSVGKFLLLAKLVGGAIGGILLAITPWVLAIGGFIALVVDFFKTQKEALAPIFDDIKETFAGLFERVKPVLEGLWKIIKPVLTVIATLFGSVIIGIIGIAKGLFEGLKDAWTGAKKVLVSVFQAIWGVLKVTLIPILEVFIGILNLLIGDKEKGIEGFKAAWESFKEGFDDITSGILTAVVGLVETIVRFLTSFASGVIKVIGGAFEWILRKVGLDDWADKIRKGTDLLLGDIEKFRDNAIEWFQNIRDKIVEYTTGLWDKAAAGWRSGSADLERIIRLLVEKVVTAVVTFVVDVLVWWETLKTDTKDAWDKMWVAILLAINTFIDDSITGIEDLVTSIAEWWETVKTDAKEKWDEIVLAVLTAINDFIADSIKAIEDFADDIETWWKTVKTDAETLWDDIKTEVETRVQEMIDAATRIIETIIATVVGIWDDLKADVTTAWDDIKTEIETRINTIVTIITDLGPALIEAGIGIVSNIWDGIVGRWEQFKTDLENKIKEVVDLLPFSEPKDPRSPFRGLGKAGKAILENVASGMMTVNIPNMFGSQLGELAKAINSPAGDSTSYTFQDGAFSGAFPGVASTDDAEGIMEAIMDEVMGRSRARSHF